MSRTIFLVCICLGLLMAEQPKLKNTGDILLNRAILLSNVTVDSVTSENGKSSITQKSIGKSVLFSAVLPGAGQFYAKSYIKAAIFLAAEVIAWGVYRNYNQQGDDQTRKFEAFADANWTEQRYWTFVYLYLNDRPDLNGFPYNQYNLIEDAAGRLVIPNWQEAESILHNFAKSQYISGFSHELPDTKTQQYYEMIGKYPEQFGNAWADARYDVRYNGGYGGALVENITPMNKTYVNMRDEANRLYDKAAYGTMIALVNHVISAIDAGFSTRRYNQRQIKLSYQNRRYENEYVNMFGLAMIF